MSRHTFEVNLYNEAAAGQKSASIVIRNFRPFDEDPAPVVYGVEFRLGASYPWVAGARNSLEMYYASLPAIEASLQQIITNGGFANLAGWSQAGVGSNWSVVSGVAQTTAAGLGENSKILNQANAVQNTQYQVEFDYTFTGSTVGKVVSLDIGDNIINSVTISASDGFKSLSINSGAGGVKIGFLLDAGASPGFMSVDNVTATSGGNVAATVEARIDGGTPFTLCTTTIYPWENAPRDTISGQDTTIPVGFRMETAQIVAQIIGRYLPVTMLPIDAGVDGGALAGSDDPTPGANGSKTKTFGTFGDPSEIEVHRTGTGTNGTTLAGHFFSILTDNTLVGESPDFQVTAIVTNPTSSGASDGAINQTVLNGVGPFSYLWAHDAAITQDVTGLVGGLYECEVTDDGNPTNIQTFFYEVVDPAEPVDLYQRTFVESSPINPIRFKNNEGVIDNVSVMNNADNTNYCENSPDEWNTPPNYEIFNIADITKVQFRSDFEIHSFIAVNVDPLIAAIPIPFTIAVDNITVFPQESGFVRDNGGSIRVYNSNQYHPAGTTIGDVIILDSVVGTYNAEYEIQDILFDIALNKQYLVVQATYSIDENQTISYLGPLRYNVYEAEITMQDLGAGVWKLTFAGNEGGIGKSLVSEWVKIQAFTPNMLVFNYRNTDNAYKVDWSTEIEMMIRVYGFFTSSVPVRDASLHRDSNDVPQMLNAYVRRKRAVSLLELPWYAVERITLIMSCDYMAVNGKEYFAEELPEGETPERYSLTKMTAVLEQKNWINEQNTHDGGDIASEEITVISGEGIDVLGI